MLSLKNLFANFVETSNDMKRFLLPLCAFCAILLSCEKIDSGTHLKEVDDVCTQMDDPLFKKYCYDYFDKNRDGKVTISEAATVKEINLDIDDDFKFVSLKGIQYFTNLTVLQCGGNTGIKELDLHFNNKLESLSCDMCYLSKLNIRNCSNIKHIDLRYSSLNNLDLSDARQLEWLYLDDPGRNPYNSVKTLDVSNCPNLYLLSVNESTTTLYVSESQYQTFFNNHSEHPVGEIIAGWHIPSGCNWVVK